MKKNDSGITLIALVMTIIVLIIIVSISSYEGSRMIATSKIQTLETNMLTIQAKAKAYAEEVDAKIFTAGKNKRTARNEQFTKKFEDGKQHYRTIDLTNLQTGEDILDQVDYRIKNSYAAYIVTKSGLEAMGLKDIVDDEEISSEEELSSEDEETPYVVIFSINDYKLMDVIYISGINYNEEEFYTLSYIQSALNGQE